MRRNSSEPPSGAIVKPPFRTEVSSAGSSASFPSTRREGSETLTRRWRNRALRRVMSSCRSG